MEETEGPASSSPRIIVGIGASAGGLDALEHFFDNVPSDTGAAFVVVQHLSPDFRSLMDEILARRTTLPIRSVENRMEVAANHIYLIPPKKEMIISGGRLLLSEREREQDLSLPIDIFFKSLAQDCGTRAVAVVLSGGGTDGSRGVRAVHEAGGLVIVQDEESAQFDGMPKNARESGVADWVLPPQEMPRALVDHIRAVSDGQPSPVPATARGMGAVYRMLEEEFGIDFTHYKPSTVTRRIERRLKLSQVDDIDEYVARLRLEREELDLLYRDLLIGVTQFFRDPEAFTLLEEQVLPELLQRETHAPLRVWVAGCATGEEVYSLAIVLHELAPKFGNRHIKIFATDMHHGSLALATRGSYSKESVVNVSPERLQRFFDRRGDAYQIIPDIRQMVVFAQHNVIKDAPFTRVDLISCRNLLIYLQPAAQQRVLGFFHFALNRGGVMWLGPSETPGGLNSDFETMEKHWRIFRKFSDVRTHVDSRLQPSAPRARIATMVRPVVGRSSAAQLLATYDTLLEEHMPPSLLITEHGDLAHAFGGASRFLHLRDGRIGSSILDMVSDDLKIALTNALQETANTSSTIVYNRVSIGESDEAKLYKVSARRLPARSGQASHILVSFEGQEGLPVAGARGEVHIDLGQVSRDRLDVVEAELNRTQNSLRAATEELESSNEELQAANEELLTSNEELQSTNEELQSVNEELYSVNAEYQRKINDLTELTNDMENLLSSTDIGTIFLDRELRIRKFTPQIAENFNLLPQDVGRSIETFAHNIDHPELVEDMHRVLVSAQAIERELRDRRGRAFFLRILPYRAKGTLDGVVLTLIDVSGLKAAEDALFHERYLLNSLLDTVPDSIYFKDARGRFIRTNQAMTRRLGLADDRAATGKASHEFANHVRGAQEHEQDEVVLRTGEAQNYVLEHWAPEGGNEHWDLVTRLPLKDAKQDTVGMIGIFRDVTAQQRAEQQIRQAVSRRDQFLAMLSHELRNPLGAIVTATGLLKEEREGKPDKLLNIVERQSNHMARLLDDLLEASRVTQNKIELRRRVVELAPIVRDAVDATRGTFESRGVALAVHIDEKVLRVELDEARMLQIHVNLLSNAAKYTPRGGHVSLSVTRDDDHALIRVSDDGVGIAADTLDQIFDLFVQSRRTIDRADGGLGLGLMLVKSLVTMHGGTVTAHSDGEGKGSEFVVRLPLAQSVADIVDAPSIRKPERVHRPRIVVVEDNKDSRLALCKLLGSRGFKCRSASDGAAGLALIHKTKPDAAIIDLGLPTIDGLELARRIRTDAAISRTFLIALTGYGQQSDHEGALLAGFDEHLVKPVDSKELMDLLGWQEAARETTAMD